MRGVRRSRALLLACALLFTGGPGASSNEGATPAVSAPRVGEEPSGLEPLLQLRGEGNATAMTIESDELEMQALPNNERVLRFERNVRVRQGDLSLRADRLEAFYPADRGEPERLRASGAVRVDQPGQSAFCAEAEYRRDLDRLTCRGEARLVRGCDEVRGDAIEFDLGAERARVVGAAQVVISPPEDEGGCRAPAEPGS